MKRLPAFSSSFCSAGGCLKSFYLWVTAVFPKKHVKPASRLVPFILYWSVFKFFYFSLYLLRAIHTPSWKLLDNDDTLP